MEIQVQPKPPASYTSLPPEVEPPRPFPFFPIAAVLLIAVVATFACIKSGRLVVTKSAPWITLPSTGKTTFVSTSASPAIPEPSIPPNAFVVTSISLAPPSFAIINGRSYSSGTPIEAPGVTGWKIKQIAVGRVWLQNGTTITAIPLTGSGLKPLDDQLHPLN